MGLKSLFNSYIDSQKKEVDKAISDFKKQVGSSSVSYVLENSRYPYHLLIQTLIPSKDTIKTVFSGTLPEYLDSSFSFKVSRTNGSLVYSSDSLEETVLNERVDVYDADKRHIGFIREVKIPLFRNLKAIFDDREPGNYFEVFYHDTLLCTLLRTDSGEIRSTKESSFIIRALRRKSGGFSIYKKGTKVADLPSSPVHIKDGYFVKYLLEYNDPVIEEALVLIAIALAHIA